VRVPAIRTGEGLEYDESGLRESVAKPGTCQRFFLDTVVDVFEEFSDQFLFARLRFEVDQDGLSSRCVVVEVDPMS